MRRTVRVPGDKTCRRQALYGEALPDQGHGQVATDSMMPSGPTDRPPIWKTRPPDQFAVFFDHWLLLDEICVGQTIHASGQISLERRAAAGRRSARRKHDDDRSLSGRLQDDAVASGERGLPCRHQQREVPRNDLTDHAERLAEMIGDRIVVEFSQRSFVRSRPREEDRRSSSHGSACRCRWFRPAPGSRDFPGGGQRSC